jgi:hypothetical protein
MYFLISSTHKKSGNKNLKTHPFPLGMKHTGMQQSRKGNFEQPGSFRDETYGDVTK